MSNKAEPGKLHLSITVTNEQGVSSQTEMDVDLPRVVPDKGNQGNTKPPVIEIPVDKNWYPIGGVIEREIQN